VIFDDVRPPAKLFVNLSPPNGAGYHDWIGHCEAVFSCTERIRPGMSCFAHRVSRSKLIGFLAVQAPGLVAMEAWVARAIARVRSTVHSTHSPPETTGSRSRKVCKQRMQC
jgi:hypothetical protein